MTQDQLADALNQHCHCISIDADALQRSLESRLDESGAWSRLQQSHPHLLADSPVFISRDHIDRMQAIIDATETIVSMPSYQELVLSWAPAIARQDWGAHGVFYGYDFHLTEDGPKLIEINSNAGGALLLLHVASAQQACCRQVENFVTGQVDATDLEGSLVTMFRDEYLGQMAGGRLQRIAIVDEEPHEQYLSPEFSLFRQMFDHHGIEAIIAGPEAFQIDEGRLVAGGAPVDMVYNRLTDFYLESPPCAPLAQAYNEGLAVFTPGPRSHALYANKRNLTVLSDPLRLAALGVNEATAQVLQAGIPKTIMVTPDNADDLWNARKQLFFKPLRGFGSRGTYRGAKLTRKTWAAIANSDYIAQQFVAPSSRLVIRDGSKRELKLDVRCYTYRGKVQLLGARLYSGQTTNFRTDGGGLAAVFMPRDPRSG